MICTKRCVLLTLQNNFANADSNNLHQGVSVCTYIQATNHTPPVAPGTKDAPEYAFRFGKIQPTCHSDFFRLPRHKHFEKLFRKQKSNLERDCKFCLELFSFDLLLLQPYLCENANSKVLHVLPRRPFLQPQHCRFWGCEGGMFFPRRYRKRYVLL